MKQLISSLQNICNQYPIKQKILIMPTYSSGHQLLQTAAKSRLAILNLRVKTLKELAREILSDYIYKNSLAVIDNSIAMAMTLNILKNLSTNNQLNYFNRLELSPGVVQAINSAIYDLRLGGFDSEDLIEDSFIQRKKREDLKAIFKKYEKLLTKNSYLDDADLFKIALKRTDPDSFKQLFIIPSNIKLTYLEREFLQVISDNKLTIINPTPVYGLKRSQPHCYPCQSSNEQIPERPLSYLHQIEDYPEGWQSPQFTITKAYGASNEVKGIIRKIKTNEIPFDSVNIYYTIMEPYVQLFYQISHKYNIPVTFGEGINIGNTKPAQLYFSLLNWIENNYSVSCFNSLLCGGNFKINDQSISPLKAAKILRESGIGWGKKRYYHILENKIESLERLLEEVDDNGLHNYYLNRIKELKKCSKFIEKILSRLPETENESVNLACCADGLINIMEDYSKIKDDLDVEARELIIEQLKTLSTNCDLEMELTELINRLKNLITELRVGASMPQPGHIHLTSYQKGIWNDREHIFLVGLDERKFPGQNSEDPVLLDQERKELENLDFKQYKTRLNLYQMSELLANTEGEINLSYSCYDPIEDREIAPASILLKLYRLQEQDSDKDFTDFNDYINETNEFIADSEHELLDETEFWLHCMYKNQGIKNINKVFTNLFKNINQGQKAREKRKDGFNKYNGNITVDITEVDSRKNNEIISASRLELIARCPYCYFLKYILGVEPPEEMVYDPQTWLDPMDRGKLLHKIFELFYRKITEQGEKPKTSKHLHLINKIAKKEAEKYRQKIAPPSDMVYERELREILDSCYVFLTSEERYNDKAVPAYFELVFGYNTDSEGEKEYAPAEIELPSGASIKVGGKIDRVDKIEDGVYNIIDYKTGSTWNFNAREYFKNGWQLQHAIYALAFEKIMENPVSVEQAGYIFPSLKGEGQRFMRPPDGLQKREEVKEIIEYLLDTVARGAFVMARYDRKHRGCNYCDYQVICNREKKDYLHELRNDNQIEELDSLRRLDDYA